LEERFKKPSEITDRNGFNGIIYGAAGVGKTLLAVSALDYPRARKGILIDIDRSSRTIAGIDDEILRIFEPETWGDIQEIFDYLVDVNARTNEFGTIITDSITESQKTGLRALVSEGSQVQLQDWGRNTSQQEAYVTAMRELSHRYGWNVIFTCQMEVEKTESGLVITRLGTTPSLSKALPYKVDAVGFLTKARDGTRQLVFEANSTNTLAKLRIPRAQIGRFPLVIEDPNLGQILEWYHNPEGIDLKLREEAIGRGVRI